MTNFQAHYKGDILVSSGTIINPTDSIEIQWRIVDIRHSFVIPEPYDTANGREEFYLDDYHYLKYWVLRQINKAEYNSCLPIALTYSIFKRSKPVEKSKELTVEEKLASCKKILEAQKEINLKLLTSKYKWKFWK